MKEIYLGMPVRIKEKGSPVKRLAVFGNLIAVAAQKARLLLSKIFQYYSIKLFIYFLDVKWNLGSCCAKCD